MTALPGANGPAAVRIRPANGPRGSGMYVPCGDEPPSLKPRLRTYEEVARPGTGPLVRTPGWTSTRLVTSLTFDRSETEESVEPDLTRFWAVAAHGGRADRPWPVIVTGPTIPDVGVDTWVFEDVELGDVDLIDTGERCRQDVTVTWLAFDATRAAAKIDLARRTPLGDKPRTVKARAGDTPLVIAGRELHDILRAADVARMNKINTIRAPIKAGRTIKLPAPR